MDDKKNTGDDAKSNSIALDWEGTGREVYGIAYELAQVSVDPTGRYVDGCKE